MSIPTVVSLRAKHRKLDRRRRGAARVITAMSRGASLHLPSPDTEAISRFRTEYA